MAAGGADPVALLSPQRASEPCRTASVECPSPGPSGDAEGSASTRQAPVRTPQDAVRVGEWSLAAVVPRERWVRDGEQAPGRPDEVDAALDSEPARHPRRALDFIMMAAAVLILVAAAASYLCQVAADYYGCSEWPPSSPSDWHAGGIVAAVLGVLVHGHALWCFGMAATTPPGFAPQRYLEPIASALYPAVTRDLPCCEKCGGRRKPLRAHHCRRCGVCVLRYDHHCMWLGQCVGLRNHKLFLHFIGSVCVGGAAWVASAGPALKAAALDDGWCCHSEAGVASVCTDGGTRPLWYRVLLIVAAGLVAVATIFTMLMLQGQVRMASFGVTQVEVMRGEIVRWGSADMAANWDALCGQHPCAPERPAPVWHRSLPLRPHLRQDGLSYSPFVIGNLFRRQPPPQPKPEQQAAAPSASPKEAARVGVERPLLDEAH